MKNRIAITAIGLAFLALCLGVSSGTAGDQVKRPYRITGTTVGTITAVTVTMDGQTVKDVVISFNLENIGEATHSGRYYNVGAGTLSLITHTGESSGIFTTAFGDIVEWSGTIQGATLTVWVTGGTGRFADGSGGFVAELTDIVVNPVVGGTLSYNFVGTGTVTY